MSFIQIQGKCQWIQIMQNAQSSKLMNYHDISNEGHTPRNVMHANQI